MSSPTKLAEIAKKVKRCTSCPLYKGTNNGVPGSGNASADIMFIGEAPGFHEDRQGLPFVGAAGKLLDKSLAAINLKRDDVFIGNMIKHRPPSNRDPSEEELEACRPYIDAQIKAINPKIIVTLGRFSMGKFIPDVKISQVHGQARWVNFNDQKILVMPMYHPAAALRNGYMMGHFQADFQKLTQILKFLNDPKANSLLTSKEETEPKKEQLSLI